MLWQDRDLIFDNAGTTLVEIAAGFGLALISGLAVAVAFRGSDLVRRAGYPLVVASQTIPVIVIAPVLVVWFGYGIWPKLLIISLICFFPITVNTLDGLRRVDPGSGADDALTGRLPDDHLPAGRGADRPARVFTGARIAAAVAVIGAVFGEWAGSDKGAGAPDPPGQRPADDRAHVRLGLRASPIAISLYAPIGLLERAVVRGGSWRQ